MTTVQNSEYVRYVSVRCDRAQATPENKTWDLCARTVDDREERKGLFRGAVCHVGPHLAQPPVCDVELLRLCMPPARCVCQVAILEDLVDLFSGGLVPVDELVGLEVRHDRVETTWIQTKCCYSHVSGMGMLGIGSCGPGMYSCQNVCMYVDV